MQSDGTDVNVLQEDVNEGRLCLALNYPMYWNNLVGVKTGLRDRQLKNCGLIPR